LSNHKLLLASAEEFTTADAFKTATGQQPPFDPGRWVNNPSFDTLTVR
jgi:hypothetical protein